MATTPSKTVSTLSNAVQHLGLPALGTWLAGLGLSSYHISVPFLGTYAVSLAGLVAVFHVAYMTSSSFHISKVEWTGTIEKAAHAAWQVVLSQQSGSDATK